MLENTTQENEVIDLIEDIQTEKPTTEKRAIISISVSAEEKRRISVEALKDYSTTVSDLIRSRMFIKTEEIDGKEKVIKSADEEIEVYKDVIQQMKTEIEDLNIKNSSLLVELNENNSLNEDEPLEELKTVTKGNIVLLEFSDNESEKGIIEKIKAFRSDLFDKLEAEEIQDFYDFEKFAKTIFLRGSKRSYNNGVLGEGTGLSIREVEASAEQEKIDYFEQV